MIRKGHTPQQIIRKLREAEILLIGEIPSMSLVKRLELETIATKGEEKNIVV